MTHHTIPRKAEALRANSQDTRSFYTYETGVGALTAKIAADTIVYSAVSIASQFMAIIRGIIVARVLGPATFGIWNGLGYIVAYSPYSNLGLFVGMSREYAYFTGKGDLRKAERVKDTAFSFGTSAACLVTLSLILMALLTKGRYSRIVRVGICAMAMATLLQRVSMFYVAIYRLKKRIGTLSLAMLMAAILYFILAVVLMGHWGLYALFVAFPVSLVPGILYLVARTDEHFRLRFDVRQFISLLRIGLPLDAGGLADTLMQTVGGMVILIFLSTTEMGYYGIGATLIGLVLQVPNSLAWVTNPYLLERYGETDDLRALGSYSIKPTLLLACLMPLVIGGVVLALPLVIRYILPAYLPGLMAIRILLWGNFFYSMIFLATNFLVAIDRQVQLVLMRFGAAALNIALLYILLSLGLRLEGVALASALSFLALGSGIVAYMMRYYIKGALALAMFLAKAYMPFAYATLLMVALELGWRTGPSSFLADVGATTLKLIAFCLLYTPVLYYGNRELGLAKVFGESIKARLKIFRARPGVWG